MYINKGNKTASSHGGLFGSFSFSRLDRGKILSIFSKLDFLLGELIRLKVIGFEFEANEKLIELIAKFQLQARVSILRDWKVIDKKLEGKLKSLVHVRNGLAHKFEEYEVSYKNLPLTQKNSLRQLSQDFSETWEELVMIYSAEQEKINIETLKIQLTKWQGNKD